MIGYSTGLVSGNYISDNFLLTGIILIIGIIGLFILVKKFEFSFSILGIFISCLIGVFHWHSVKITELKYPFPKENLKKVKLFGVIENIELTRYDRVNLIIKADSVLANNKKILFSDKIKTSVKDKNLKKLDRFYNSISIGDRFSSVCNLRKGRDKRNPGEFDFYQYLLENEITALAYVKSTDSVKIIKNSSFFDNLVFETRKNIDSRLRKLNDQNTYSLLRGLILADRNLISYEDKENFVNSGVIHVLAVSGLHVGYIAIIFLALFSRFHIFTRSVLTILGLLLFMFITGVPSSVFRATLMGVILILGKISGRGNCVFNNLAIAALLILIIRPTDIFNPGFQLSFSAVLSIITFTPYLTEIIGNLKIPKFLSWTLTLFIVSFAAQIGTIPFTLAYFGKLSIVSLLVNLIVIPLIGIIIGIAITGLGLSFFSMSIAVFYSVTNNLLTKILFTVTEITGDLQYSFIKINNFSLWDSILFYLAVFIFTFSVVKFSNKVAIFFVFVLALFIYVNLENLDDEKLLQENLLTVCAIDIGQGDAFLLKFPNGKTALIDAGNATPYFDNGKRVILPLLDHLGIARIDFAFISHLDSDHYKGILSLIQNDKIDLVYKPPLDTSLQKDLKFEEFLKNHDVKFKYYRKEILDIGNCRLYFLADTKSPFYADFDVNNKSGIIKLIHGNNTFLFVGDAEHEMESYLSNCYKDFLKSDYLKVSHHGSKTGTIPEFLNFVKPEIAVISAGRENRFKHPSPSVVERLKKIGSTIERTDKQGAVIYQSNGNEIEKIYWR